jgi:hypothetical protein
MNKEIYNFTVGELIKILQQYPANMPVVVSGYESEKAQITVLTAQDFINL